MTLLREGGAREGPPPAGRGLGVETAAAPAGPGRDDEVAAEAIGAADYRGNGFDTERVVVDTKRRRRDGGRCRDLSCASGGGLENLGKCKEGLVRTEEAPLARVNAGTLASALRDDLNDRGRRLGKESWTYTELGDVVGRGGN